MNTRTAVVVCGEASESDDECAGKILTNKGTNSPRMSNATTCGTIVSGEAPESDDDGTSLSSASVAIDVMTCSPYADVEPSRFMKNTVKYNSLLHKKLCTDERNEAFGRDISELCEDTVSNGACEFSGITGKLLKTELTLQEAAYHVRNASVRSKNLCNVVNQILTTDFMHYFKDR